jgi:3-methylfumaryl-CoA hydratase
MTDFAALQKLENSAGRWRDDTDVVTGRVTADQLRLIAECLQGPVPDMAVPDTVVPPMWLLATCTRWADAAALGDDGHPVTGVGYPPMIQRRRLFAGGRLQVHHPVQVGDVITRRTRVTSVTAVRARTGPLLFVTLRHEFTDDAAILRCVEEQDLAYRSGDARAADSRPPKPPTADGGVWLQTSGVQLFRFSALTANSHRIHYDHDYAVRVEKLPGVLVHGPLLALLMLETARRLAAERVVATFSYRLSQPVVCGAQVCARVNHVHDAVWDVEVVGPQGIVATGAISFAG